MLPQSQMEVEADFGVSLDNNGRNITIAVKYKRTQTCFDWFGLHVGMERMLLPFNGKIVCLAVCCIYFCHRKKRKKKKSDDDLLSNESETLRKAMLQTEKEKKKIPTIRKAKGG